MHSIRLGAKRCALGWKSYDEQFRLRMSQDPAGSWAVVDPELWLLYMYPPSSNKSKLLRHLWDKGWTPINIIELNTYLGDYANRVDAQLLLEGFTFGFRIQYEGPRISTTAKNLVSAEIHKFETLAKLHDEVKLGRILGPFSKKPISTLRISPIGLVQKPDKGWRLISHLSYPSGDYVRSVAPASGPVRIVYTHYPTEDTNHDSVG
ncbi:unnamed protein product [Mytilus edulis]|uniref:Uncharacterized protein n=1 Tax=Mytilus edulis TaxID=6550 RepID=A0A8S3UM57_MYTED|nr:unnamed protein product [Mytilus edulis]